MSEFQDVSPVGSQGMGMQPCYAGFWWRFLASFIDGLIVQGAGCLIGLGLGLVFGVAMISTGGDETTSTVLQGVLNLISFAVGLILAWLYSALMESSQLQATLGKKICRLQVTGCPRGTANLRPGNRPLFRQVSLSLALFGGLHHGGLHREKTGLARHGSQYVGNQKNSLIKDRLKILEQAFFNLSHLD